MKILVSAMACNPVTGSEAHFGWAGVRALAREHEVHVLTFDFNRPFISDADRAELPGVTWHFLGRFRGHHPNLVIARLAAWQDTATFQDRQILPYARTLHAREKFDLAHHLTISSWRLPSPLWKLGIPLIWGPLGGGESIPRAFHPMLSPATRRMEFLRQGHSFFSRYRSSLRTCANRASTVLASNPETAVLLRTLRKDGAVNIVSSAFFTPPDVARLQRHLHEKSWQGPLQLFAGGSLEGRKGLAVALNALAKAKAQGLSFRFRICGEGPELRHLQSLCARLGITQNVSFERPLSGAAYEEALHTSHIYLLPSLRENAGLTLMEAMLSGCVPIVAKLGGPGLIVPDSVGFPIDPQNPAQLANDIRTILLRLDSDRHLCRSLADDASAHIAREYSEARYLSKVYADLIPLAHRQANS
ncbi:MAG: glycosyltransferase family 4 protein [Verrucomicrobia bacterium]|nr:glycosyltransferase family 4 protein [Verrucomicrobiota bacterium]